MINGVTQLEILDFSHNRISNDGAIALAKLISWHKSLQELKLCNNYIGSLGIEGISFALARSPALAHLDLRLNSYVGDEGGIFLCSALSQNTKLKSLFLAACGLGSKAGKFVGEMFKVNSTLLEMDLSNNDLTEESGELLNQGLIKNFKLQKLDLRMTNVSQAWEFAINEQLARNIANSTRNNINSNSQPNMKTIEES
ncbi:dynein regulatory complex subunit 5-like [Hetaerina americana]|uniref:dynein regulatory complex subunit 5-like n=1 Tax=Hetaerina americana TaxID=62018 RepID=UPI003A7F5221